MTDLAASARPAVARRPGLTGRTGRVAPPGVALAIVLVIGAGLMIRSFVRLQRTNLGFDPRGLVTLNLQLPKRAYPTDDDVLAFWKRLLEGAQSLPGVSSATLMSGLPPQRRLATAGSLGSHPPLKGKSDDRRRH